jgi:hypothetical protein
MPLQNQTEAILVGVFVALAVLLAVPIQMWRATQPQRAKSLIVLEGGLSVFPRSRLTGDTCSSTMRRPTGANCPSPARQTSWLTPRDTQVPPLHRSNFSSIEEYLTHLANQGNWVSYKLESEQMAKLKPAEHDASPASKPSPPGDMDVPPRPPFFPVGPNTPDYGTMFDDANISADEEPALESLLAPLSASEPTQCEPGLPKTRKYFQALILGKKVPKQNDSAV